MQKIILLFILSLTMIMGDFTLSGSTLIPNTQELTTNTTNTTSTTNNQIPPTKSSAKTNWGFQPFSIPASSVTVPAGGDIQAAIASLPNGGTVNLEEGVYYAYGIRPKSNIVLQGAGIDKTTIKFKGPEEYALISAHGGNKTDGLTNIILRNFKADCTGTKNANGIEFIYGVSNVLVEDVEVFGANKSNIMVNQGGWGIGGEHYTFRNIHSYDTTIYHGIRVKYVKGCIIDNYSSHDTGEFGVDLSRVMYAEILNTTLERCGSGGAKFPSCNYVYIHDTIIKDNPLIGIKINYGSDPTGLQHLHFENLIVQNSNAGITQWGDTGIPTAEELVVRNVSLIDNIDAKGITFSNIRIKGCNNVHEYDKNIGITVASKGVLANVFTHDSGTTPKEDGVGWTSWPSF